jgi:hypothetical protein
MREAAKWLQAAFDGGHNFARLHLAHLTFDAGLGLEHAELAQPAALAHLANHLSWLVQHGRETCAGCGQTRGEDTPMLMCNGCRVARFCSADHQKMASKKAALGGNLFMKRHKDICNLRSTQQVARGCQGRCVTRLMHCRPGGVFTALNCPLPAGIQTQPPPGLCTSLR